MEDVETPEGDEAEAEDSHQGAGGAVVTLTAEDPKIIGNDPGTATADEAVTTVIKAAEDSTAPNAGTAGSTDI